MSYDAETTFEGEYVCVQVNADDSYETSIRFFNELARACEKYECRKILVLSNSTPLGTMDAYDHGKIIREAGFTIKHRMAWIELNPKAKEMDEFIETVLTNRGVIRAKLFSEVSEAKLWLLRDNKA